MQLTLTSPGRAPLGENVAPSRMVASPSRAQSLSQLDRIAAANSRPSSQGLGGVATWLAVLGGFVVVAAAAMWQDGTASSGSNARSEAAEVSARVATGVAPLQAPVDSARPVVAVEAAPSIQADAPLTVPTPAALGSTAADAPPPAVIDDTARKARLAVLAEARRKAALVAQQRAQAEESQRMALIEQQREAAARAEQAAEAARRAAAAEPIRPAAMNVSEAPRLTVRASCASSGGFMAQQFCQARECSKAEHQGDAVCTRLRESEAERLRASNDR